MTIEKRRDGWWITRIPKGTPDCGPYDTKAEAERDARGMGRYFKRYWKEGGSDGQDQAGGRWAD